MKHHLKLDPKALFVLLALLTFAASAFILIRIGQKNQHQQVSGSIGYEPAVILDAGHGGMDGGAVAQSGQTEKELNLLIAQKSRMLLKLMGVDCVMTRDSDISLDYEEGASVRQNKQNDLRARVKVAERFPESCLISIHMNQFSQTKYHGAQVFYGKAPEGQILAQHMQDAFRQALDPENDRKIKPSPDGVYLMKKVTAPAVIAECGFLSNPQEAEKLGQDPYQTKASLAIVSSYLRFAGEKEETK